MTQRAQPKSNFQDIVKTTVSKVLRTWSRDSKTKIPPVSRMQCFRILSHTVVMATKEKTSQETTYYFFSAFWRENCRSAGLELSPSCFKGKAAYEFCVVAATEIGICASYLYIHEIKVHIHRILFWQHEEQLITSKRAVVMTCDWHAHCERSHPLPMLLTSFSAQARMGNNKSRWLLDWFKQQ